MDNREQKIKDILSHISCNALTIGCDEDLFENGILDSLGMARFLPEIEKVYNIEFDLDDIVPENFVTIRNILVLLNHYGVK